MLLERNQALIGTITAIVIAIGTVFAVGATGGLFVPGERYLAEFEDAAGLESGSFIFMAGVRIGQVVDVELEPDMVRVEFSSTAPRIPSDSSADIIIANTLGKRAIRINPGSSSTDLEEGDTIPLAVTGTPIDIPELGDRSAELLTELDVATLQELTTALADVAAGSEEDLRRLLVGLEAVSQIVVDRRDELERLLQEGTVLIDAIGEADQDIIRIIDAFGSTLDTLDGRRGDVQRLLNETVDVTDTANALLLDREEQIREILDDLHTSLEIVDAHQVDLAHTFAYIGVGLEGFSSIGYSGLEEKADNTSEGRPGWGNVALQELGPIGAELLLGCGAPLDEALTELTGPDPDCAEAETEGAATVAGDEISPADAPRRMQYAGVGSFFMLGGAR